MMPLVWAMALLALACALILLEMFIPSGGLLSLLAAVATCGAIAMAYHGYGFSVGTGFLVGVVFLVPLVLGAAIRWWPYTPMGRQILNLPPEHGETTAAVTLPFEALLGKRGQAKTKMVPSGAIVVEGQSYDAVSEAGFVDQGATVQVTRVDSNRIVVRIVTGDEIATVNQESEENDLLSRPASDVIPGEFEDPLA